MNLVFEYNKFNIRDVFFNESVKNTIMDNSNFIRIIYSNKDFVLNGIYIKIDLYKTIYSHKSNKIYLNNDTMIQFVDKLETDILNKYNKDNKQKLKKIKENIVYLINKLNSSQTHNSICYQLKISGIWETINTIGLTFKFIYINENKNYYSSVENKNTYPSVENKANI